MENKIYTIKDLMENEGEVFVCIDDHNSYKFENNQLFIMLYEDYEWLPYSPSFDTILSKEFKLDEKEAIKELIEERYSGEGKVIVNDEYGDKIILSCGDIYNCAWLTNKGDFGEEIAIKLEKEDIIRLKESLEEILKLYD